MAVVVVRGPLGGGGSSTLSNRRRMYLYAESTGAISFSVPYAPREIEYGGWAQEWASLDRSGNTPLLLRKGQMLETLRFTALIADPDSNVDMSNELTAVKVLARTRQRVLVRYSGLEAGLWRITEVTATSTRRHPVTNAVTAATVSFTLTQASDAAPAAGPIARPAPPPAPPPAPVRRYTVVRGDCLWFIAQRFYGNGGLWPRIYDANRAVIGANPHLIYAGQIYTIP
jgi:LysM repeat protein